jgi:hypothetical protein
MALPVVVVKVAVSFSKTPVVATVMVGKVTVTAPELSSAAAFGKITATHMRSISHAVRPISAHGVRSTIAHRMGSTSTAGSTTTAFRVCGTTTTTAAASSATLTSVTLGYQGYNALVTWKSWQTG